MIYNTHKEAVIQQNIKNLKPSKYNKFFWWRRFQHPDKPIHKKSSIPDKIEAGYYSYPHYFWEAQLSLLELNELYNSNKDYGVFVEKSGVPKSRYKRLMDDFYREEKIKLERVIDDFTDGYILKKEQVQEIVENFDGTIQELYEYFEKNHSYVYSKSWKRTF